jgi:hypothetical protein
LVRFLSRGAALLGSAHPRSLLIFWFWLVGLLVADLIRLLIPLVVVVLAGIERLGLVLVVRNFLVVGRLLKVNSKQLLILLTR